MRKTKVLVVDDEVEFASTLSERLRLRNYDAKAVYSAEDALSFARSERPDVILLDLKMPRMSGIETLKTIKETIPNIEVILLTGHVDIENEIEGIKLGSFDYIMKPLKIDDLVSKIDEARQKHNKV